MLWAQAAALLCAAGGRHVVNLNEGWQFARIPEAPSIWKGGDEASTANWRVVFVTSQETAAEDGRVENAFDGNPNTFWHSKWSGTPDRYPYVLTIDLGSNVDVEGVRFLTRQTGPKNGRPKNFQLFLGDSLEHLSVAATEGAIPNSDALFEKRFPHRFAHYARLVFQDSWKNEPFLALSEIGLIRHLSLKDRRDWASQYNIASVATGGDRFDPSPAEIEQLKAHELTAPNLAWRSAVLPHTPWIRKIDSVELWQGVTYYRRPLNIATKDLQKQVWLTLGGAMQNSDVWLNGVRVGGRRGGFLPVVVDLTGRLKTTNSLLVRLDNRDNPLIPPGKPQQEMDFIYGCGLYRDADLTITDPLHVTDPLAENVRYGGGVYVTNPLVSTARSVVRIRTNVRNSGSHQERFKVRQTLTFSDGRGVAVASQESTLSPGRAWTITQDLSVSRPHLWSPGDPNLYILKTEILRGDRPVDCVATRIGIRSVEVSRSKGFVINGKQIRLIGTNRHQDYPWVGVALTDRDHYRDVRQIRLAGHNIVRLSHYPHSPAFMDACDEEGLMNIPCIPGWQFLNSDPRFKARVLQDIRELIRRDRNHPSAVFWEASLNETYPPNSLADEWNGAAKSESLDGRVLTAGDSRPGAPWDIGYNSWVDADMSRPQDGLPTKPGYIREYGDYEFGGSYSSTRVRIGAGIDKLLQAAWNHVWSINRYRPQYPWTMGAGTWAMFDDNGPWEFKISAWGLSDLFRRPKPSFWFFQSQQALKPMLRIAATWEPGPKTRDIVVFTNCDSALLKLNGWIVATAKPDRGPTTPYAAAKPFDGSNTANLSHPPIVFRGIRYQPGALTVVGLRAGKPVAVDQVRTPGRPAKLRLWMDDLGVPVGVNDQVFVRAAIVDSEGTTCDSRSDMLHFSANQGGTLLGERDVKCEMGEASALLRTSAKAGVAMLTVSCPGLQPAHIQIQYRER